MVQRIDSQALGKVNAALGITGHGSPDTELMDGTVEQVLNVGPIVRRSQTLAGTQGMFRIMLRNIHAGAGPASSGIDPYNPTGTGSHVIAPYPDPMPNKFDLWLFGACVTRFSGSGGFSSGKLHITNIILGCGVDSAGAPLTSFNIAYVLAFWDTIQTAISPATGMGQDGTANKRIGLRMPRDGVSPGAEPTLQFISDAAGVATFDCNILVGVFATALGQDGMV